MNRICEVAFSAHITVEQFTSLCCDLKRNKLIGLDLSDFEGWMDWGWNYRTFDSEYDYEDVDNMKHSDSLIYVYIDDRRLRTDTLVYKIINKPLLDFLKKYGFKH